MVWAFSDFWAVGWFLFLGFCRVSPVCTVSILRVFIFFAGWFIARLVFSVLLIFIFLKALGQFWLFVWCFLVVLSCFSITFLCFLVFLSFCQLFLTFVVFSLEFL